MSTVASVQFTDHATSVPKALDLIGARELLPESGLIVLKPNLTNADPPPVTTDVRAVEAVYHYCRRYTRAEIVIGEGCGSGVTADAFEANGYTELAARHGLRLIDFNEEDAVLLRCDDALQEKEFHLPRVLVDAYVISIPVLKDHLFTGTTVAMKNMFGIAPAPFYQGSWNKSDLHTPSTDAAVVDICLYKRPGLSVVDASVALTGSHLWGTPEKHDRILASADPVAVDAVASCLLGHAPEDLEYLRLADADGRLGSYRDVRVVG